MMAPGMAGRPKNWSGPALDGRSRHPEHHRGLFVLRHGRAAGVMHGPQPLRPVIPDAGEQDADSVAAMDLGDARKQ